MSGSVWAWVVGESQMRVSSQMIGALPVLSSFVGIYSFVVAGAADDDEQPSPHAQSDDGAVIDQGAAFGDAGQVGAQGSLQYAVIPMETVACIYECCALTLHHALYYIQCNEPKGSLHWTP